MTKRPASSRAAIESPQGVVTQSNRWMYTYAQSAPPTFTADVDGEYALQLQAKLVFEDRVYPDNRSSTSSLSMHAMNDGSESCSAVPLDASAMVLGLVLLALRRRQ